MKTDLFLARVHLAMSSALLIGMAALCSAVPSNAEVKQINITGVQSPTFAGASFGSVGQYELIQGTITGEVDPSNPQDAVIVDIQNAPRNAQGMVTYSADFRIFRPINLSNGNPKVLYDPRTEAAQPPSARTTTAPRMTDHGAPRGCRLTSRSGTGSS